MKPTSFVASALAFVSLSLLGVALLFGALSDIDTALKCCFGSVLTAIAAFMSSVRSM